jgi:unsaturated chondroitin disaccharide hydrolase
VTYASPPPPLPAGRVQWKGTHQGLSNTSTWARGQAWALHGFTQAYEATGQALFRRAARRAADRFLAALPRDGVPLWDFDAPKGQVRLRVF